MRSLGFEYHCIGRPRVAPGACELLQAA
jgi:hypothetical protein